MFTICLWCAMELYMEDIMQLFYNSSFKPGDCSIASKFKLVDSIAPLLCGCCWETTIYNNRKKKCLLKIDIYITYEHGKQNNRKKQYNARMQKYVPLPMVVCMTFLTSPLSSFGFTALPNLAIKACNQKFQNSISKYLHLVAMSQMLSSSSKSTFVANNHPLSMSSFTKRTSLAT